MLALRAERPYWGERKLRAYLEREHPQQSRPASSTIGELLKRHGLTCPPKRGRRATPSATLHDAVVSNEVWAIDFKGRSSCLTAHTRRETLRSGDDFRYGEPLSIALPSGGADELRARAAAA